MPLRVHKIPNTNSIVMTQDSPREFFIGTKETIIISVPVLISTITFMVKIGVLSKKLLEGILTEVNE